MARVSTMDVNPTFRKVAGPSILLSLLAVAIAAEGVTTTRSDLQAVKDDLTQGRVTTLRISFLPYEFSSSIAVAPKVLLRWAPVTKDVTVTNEIAQSLAQAVDSTKMSVSDSNADLRWALRFMGSDGRELHAIYMDGPMIFRCGRRGVVNGQRVAFDNSLANWLENEFPDVMTEATQRLIISGSDQRKLRKHQRFA